MRIAVYVIFCFSLIAGCAPRKSFFKTPNDFNKINGTINMTNGTIKKGLITISFENEQSTDNQINILSATDTVSEKLDARTIKSYIISGKTYVPKIINVRLEGEKHFLFVERLTDENMKMQLYKLLPPWKNSFAAGDEPYYYYISFPSFDKYDAIDINSSKLVPLFEIKMAAYITDCPDLQAKIQAKEKNYYYPLLSFGFTRIDVIKNIAEKYNNCK